jgi:Putative phage tail protein/Domain of unknown function (DUF1983)
MSGLFGSNSTSTAETPLNALNIQSSAAGVPIPIVYGTTRVTPNMLWYDDFKSIAHTTTQSGGGKGGYSSTSTTYTYTASFILGLCEGTIANVLTAWIDKTVSTTPNTLFSIFNGTYPQTPWSYLTSNHSGQALGYQGIAYVAASAYDLASSANLPNHSFEVAGKLILSGTSDADPRDIVNDLLTNASYGVPNAPALSGLTQYSNYCKAAHILLSPCYDTQVAAAQMITELMQLTNTGIYSSEGLLKLVPYGDATLTGNGATYTPNLTVIADFGDDNFLPLNGDDPIKIKRNAVASTVNTTSDAFNQVTVEFLDRAHGYNVATVVVQDQAAIDVYGLRPMQVLVAHQITDGAVANVVATLILQRAVYVRSQYEFRLGWQWCYLEPTDLVTINDVGLGLSSYPVRILSVEEDEFGKLTVLAEDAPTGVFSHIVVATPSNTGYNVNQGVTGGDTNTPVIFEPPNALTAPDFQLWVAASGGSTWGGCNVWASSDGSSYKLVGTIHSQARHGVLTSTLAAGSDPDTSHTLAVDLTVSQGQLLAGSSADADAGNTMLWVDGELISYSAATLTSAYHYSLGTYLRRGQKGTTNASHLIGAQFARLDDAIFKFSVSTDRIGSPIYLKFPSFNIWGESTQSLSAVAAYTHTFAGNKPLPVASLAATGGMFLVNVSWSFVAGQVDRDYTEIWGATTNNRASAFLISSIKNPATTFTHNGLTPAQTWYYWARVVDTSGNDSDFYPAGATAGVAASPSADASALMTQLVNSLGLAQLSAELATPIKSLPGALTSNAAAAIQSALDGYDLQQRMVWQESATNATMTMDPVTGKWALLATANVTTDIAVRLTSVEVLANASAATLTATVATLSTVQGNLTSTQAAVSILQSTVSVGASQVYVDSSIANAVGGINVTAANSMTALANAEIQAAMDMFTGQANTRALTSSVAIANDTLNATATALQAEATSRSALVAVVAANGAAIISEATARANADSALASSISTLTATVSTNLATLTTEQTTRANADSALSTAITTLTANGPTGYAAVVSSASASASAITGLQAQYVLKVDVNGHTAGMQLASGSGGSSVIFLADKFAFVAPDGSGAPKNVMVLGNIGGVATFGMNGNMIVDGTIVAQSLAVTSLSSVTANLGTVTAGRAQNASNTNFVDFNATGSSIFMQVGSNVSIDAAGNATFNGIILSRNMLVATGSIGGGASINGYSAIVDTGVSVGAWGSTETYVCVVSPDSGVYGSYTTFYGTYPEIRSTGKLIHTWRWATASTIKIQIDCAVDWAPGWVSYTFGAGGIRWNLYKVT